MSASDTKLLAVRLSEAERRRIKSLAASQGLTLRGAVHEAFEAWASQLQPEGAPSPDPLPGPLPGAGSEKPKRQAGTDVPKPGREAGAAKPTQTERRATEARPASGPTGGQAPKPEGDPDAWLRRAASLDWSRCAAVESVPGKSGSVWVVRGTRAPLAAVFRSFAQGHPLGEIIEAYGLTLEQLKAVLQFAAEAFVLPPAN